MTEPAAVEVVAKRVRTCRFCHEPIEPSASVCYHCHRAQRRIQHLLDYTGLISLVNALVASGFLVLGFFQFKAAREYRSDAAEALKSAKAATATASEALARAKDAATAAQLKREVNSSFGTLFDQICKAAQGRYDFASNTCRLPNGEELTYQSVTTSDRSEN